jgi:hypothetical protein
MELQRHYRIARLLFWFAQAIGIFMAAALLLFIGGTLITELIQDLIDIKEDYMVFVFFLCEVFMAAAFIISWFRKRMGALLIIVLSILISILWGREAINIVYLHLPLLFSGLLLLFYSYYKEWILKQKA